MHGQEVKKRNNCVCAVAVCKSRKLHSDSIIFHRFPKDIIQQKKWAHACKRNDKLVNPKTAMVCSNHFQATDYERDLTNELLNLPIRKWLKQTAVPSLKLNFCEDEKPSMALIHRTKLKEKREQKEIVQQLLHEASQTSETVMVINCRFKYVYKHIL